MAAEPFYNVEPNDVFPEQFPAFLFPPGIHRETFNHLHPELKDPAWWTAMQERLRANIQDDLENPFDLIGQDDVAIDPDRYLATLDMLERRDASSVPQMSRSK